MVGQSLEERPEIYIFLTFQRLERDDHNNHLHHQLDGMRNEY